MRTLDAASQEDEDDVQELWAKLIVKAATASDKPSINKVHIEILRLLTPADSALLELLHPSIVGREFKSPNELKSFNEQMHAKAEGKWRQFPEEARAVSVQNLIRLRCITATPRVLNADRVLQEFVGRDRYNRGALVDPKRLRWSSLTSCALSMKRRALSRTTHLPQFLYTTKVGLGWGSSGRSQYLNSTTC
jgi:hypothetical protein